MLGECRAAYSARCNVITLRNAITLRCIELVAAGRKREAGGQGLGLSVKKYAGTAQTFLFFAKLIKRFMMPRMTFESLPYEPRKITATEAVLERIYEAARKGLKGDSLAYAAGLTPQEYRHLMQLDPIAEYAEQKGRAESEAEMADVLRTAALQGDTKAALDILKHVHKWTAPQSVQVQVEQRISILAALEEAQMRVIEGADADILSGRRTETDGHYVVATGEERSGGLRKAGVSVGKAGDAS
jgi:hypothetical protein